MLFTTTLVLFIPVLFILYLIKRNQYFQKINVYTPPGALLGLGHLAQFAKVPFGIKLREWTSKYGTTYGIFEGGAPVLVTSDLDILMDVFQRQYENFHARKTFPLAKNPETDRYASMFTARGARWKRIRSISNPVFKTANLKKINPLLTLSCDEFLDQINKRYEEGNSFDIMPHLQLFTCDLIAKLAFGEKKNMQTYDSNPYLRLLKQFFPDKPNFSSSIWHLLPMMFPEISHIFSFFYHAVSTQESRKSWYHLQTVITEMIEERKTKGESENGDFIDFFLESECSDEEIAQTLGSLSELKALKIEKKLTTEEIVGQLMLFLIAGYETTANSLSYLIYHLMLNPEIQEQCYHEIMDVTGGDKEISYDQCGKMKFVETCIKEVLRLYPLASFVQARTCMHKTTVGKEGLVIPEGLVVLADNWTIQRNKEYWGEDADEFRPDRFNEVDQSKINNYWLPFGVGPRICIGMRLALLEQKLLLARVLQEFKVVRAEETAVPIELSGALTVVAKNVIVKLEKR